MSTNRWREQWLKILFLGGRQLQSTELEELQDTIRFHFLQIHLILNSSYKVLKGLKVTIYNNIVYISGGYILITYNQESYIVRIEPTRLEVKEGFINIKPNEVISDIAYNPIQGNRATGSLGMKRFIIDYEIGYNIDGYPLALITESREVIYYDHIGSLTSDDTNSRYIPNYYKELIENRWYEIEGDYIARGLTIRTLRDNVLIDPGVLYIKGQRIDIDKPVLLPKVLNSSVYISNYGRIFTSSNEPSLVNIPDLNLIYVDSEPVYEGDSKLYTWNGEDIEHTIDESLLNRSTEGESYIKLAYIDSNENISNVNKRLIRKFTLNKLRDHLDKLQNRLSLLEREKQNQLDLISDLDGIIVRVNDFIEFSDIYNPLFKSKITTNYIDNVYEEEVYRWSDIAISPNNSYVASTPIYGYATYGESLSTPNISSTYIKRSTIENSPSGKFYHNSGLGIILLYGINNPIRIKCADNYIENINLYKGFISNGNLQGDTSNIIEGSFIIDQCDTLSIENLDSQITLILDKNNGPQYSKEGMISVDIKPKISIVITKLRLYLSNQGSNFIGKVYLIKDGITLVDGDLYGNGEIILNYPIRLDKGTYSLLIQNYSDIEIGITNSNAYQLDKFYISNSKEYTDRWIDLIDKCLLIDIYTGNPSTSNYEITLNNFNNERATNIDLNPIVTNGFYKIKEINNSETLSIQSIDPHLVTSIKYELEKDNISLPLVNLFNSTLIIKRYIEGKSTWISRDIDLDNTYKSLRVILSKDIEGKVYISSNGGQKWEELRKELKGIFYIDNLNPTIPYEMQDGSMLTFNRNSLKIRLEMDKDDGPIESLRILIYE